MFTHTLFGGEKTQWLIAFYGYGQSSAVYESLYQKISDNYNLIVIDNPMHDYHQDIRPEDFQSEMQSLLDHYGIDKFQTISYSMGSRLNLYIPLFFPEQLQQIILVAPDGIATNFWNRAAVNTPWGKRLFHFFVQQGDAYMKTLTFFNRIGIVNQSLFAFSKWHMRDEQRRKNVYNAWMNMRLMRPNLKTVNLFLEQYKIPMLTFFGKQDPVISLALQKKCAQAFPGGEHRLIDSDHNLLGNNLFSIIAKELIA